MRKNRLRIDAARRSRVISRKLQPFGTTIFSEMTQLAIDHGAINLSQGFPDFEGPPEIIEEVKQSGIRGRGGAGFTTATKWQAVASQVEKERYIICNGDEGGPGAFMDRMLLESYPYRIIEGMVIAAYAVGAVEGILYIRAEYPLAIDRLKLAMIQMHDCGLLGENILGSGFGLDIRLKEGAGAFVCGEETALIASVEGRRGSAYRGICSGREVGRSTP